MDPNSASFSLACGQGQSNSSLGPRQTHTDAASLAVLLNEPSPVQGQSVAGCRCTDTVLSTASCPYPALGSWPALPRGCSMQLPL